MDGAVSDWNEVNKGVPQSWPLYRTAWNEVNKGVPQSWPLLFVLFMNDLPDVVQDCSMGL